MINLAENISKYIEYLRQCSLNVSVHFAPECIARLPYQVWQKLLPYNSHTNPYCMAVKSCLADECLAHQRAIREREPAEPCVRCCHAGVAEYVFPIVVKESVLGYAAVSGYLGDESLAADCAVAKISALSRAKIPHQVCETLLPPLSVMLAELFRESEKLDICEENMISQFLAEHHTTISFDNFCRHFSRSRSYMSHKFAKMFGKSFAEYCNELKLIDAAHMLLIGGESVTDVAMAAGFGDVSYFIRLFKARYGVSPLKYRKQQVP